MTIRPRALHLDALFVILSTFLSSRAQSRDLTTERRFIKNVLSCDTNFV